MKTKKLFVALLAWCMMAPVMNAQSLVQRAFDALVNNRNVKSSSNLESSTEPSLPGNPLASMCNVYTFSMDRNNKSLLDDILTAFNQEKNESDCYSTIQRVNDKSRKVHGLYVGEDVNNTIDFSTDPKCNYVVQCWRDNKRRNYRYGYGVEWKIDDDDRITGRLVVTYAKIHDNDYNINVRNYNGAFSQNGDVASNINSSEEALAVFSRLKDLMDMNLKVINTTSVNTDEKNSIEYTALTIYQTIKQTKTKCGFTSGEKKLLKDELSGILKRIKDTDHFLGSNVSYTKNCGLANSIHTSMNYLELTKKLL